MSNHSKIDTHDDINVPGVSKSDVTGTTVGNKRALDVAVIQSGESALTTEIIIQNLSLAANTVTSFNLPADCFGITIKVRENKNLQISSDVSMLEYLTIPPGANFNETGRMQGTLYLKTTNAATLEIASRVLI
jgi:hypothetical protein